MKGFMNLPHLLNIFVFMLATFTTRAALPIVTVRPPANPFVNEGSVASSFTVSCNVQTQIFAHFEMTGTATKNVDYTLLNSSPVVIGPSGLVQVRSIQNTLLQPFRTITLRLLENPSYTLGEPREATITIMDNDFLSGTNSATAIKLNPPPPVVSQKSNLVAIVSAIDLDADRLIIELLANNIAVARSTNWSRTETNVVLQWTNPPPGKWSVGARAYDDRGFQTNSLTYEVLVGVDVLPGIPQTNLAQVSWEIPISATHLEAYVRFSGRNFVGPEFYAFEQGSTAPPEFVGFFTSFTGSNPVLDLDVTPWAQRFAGKTFVLQISGDPALHAARLNTVQLILTTPETRERAPRIEWLPQKTLFTTNEQAIVQAKISSPDIAIFRWAALATNRVSPLTLAMKDEFLPPGTNIVSVPLPNLTNGAYALFMIASGPGWQAASELKTFQFGAPERLPKHDWLASSGTTFFVIDAAGRIHAWGDNRAGQLGLGYLSTEAEYGPSRPVAIEPPPAAKFVQISPFPGKTFAILDNGSLYKWGDNNPNPTIVPPFPSTLFHSKLSGRYVGDERGRLRDLLGGGTGGSFWSDFASDESHFLGAIGAKLYRSPTSFETPITPSGVTNWLDLSTSAHYLAIGSDRQLYGGGPNQNGELPLPIQPFYFNPTKAAPVERVSGWARVVAGPAVNLAIDSQGRLFWWGPGFDGATPSPNVPREVEFLKGRTNWLDITVTSANAMALSEQGELFVWGLAGAQQIEGLPNLLDPAAPAPPPQVVGLFLANGELRVRIVGAKNVPARLQYSTDLATWHDLGEIPNARGVSDFPVAEGEEKYFLRVAPPR